MRDIPANLKYTEDHEWVRMEPDGTCVIGITDHAQASLGDITFVELPAEGDAFAAGDTFGVVESVKAASDLYMPISGKVLAINTDLPDTPETVNSDPYGAAWMIRVQPEDASAIDNLLTAEAYQNISD